MRYTTILLLSFFMLSTELTQAAITNGSFENNFTGWTTYGSVDDIFITSNSPSNGSKCAYLSNYSSSLGSSSGTVYLEQNFSAYVGQQITLDFRGYKSMNIEYGGSGAATAQIQITGSSYSQYYNIVFPSSSLTWTTKSFTPFTSAGEYKIRFYLDSWATDGYSPQTGKPLTSSVTMDLYVDNVQLVPEPSTFVLLGMGAVGFFGFALRRYYATTKSR